jgi:hypothetical protein
MRGLMAIATKMGWYKAEGIDAAKITAEAEG